jgi:regulator of replication initiation timing
MTTKEEIQTEINDVLGDLPSNIEKLIRERNTAQKLINKLDEENTALKEERDTLKAKLDKLREALS